MGVGNLPTCRYPLVSIVVPTYSRAEMLERALGSIARQTYPNMELIIVDDNGLGTCSQIDTEKKVSTFAIRTGLPVKYHCHETNQGSAAARNTGIRLSTGEYISFLDDDDVYFPNRIEAMLPLMLKHDDAGLVYSYCRAVKDNGEHTDYRQTFEGNCLFEQAFTGCICATSQWLCRKTALIDCGCFDIVPAKDDSILLYKLLLRGYSIYCVPKTLSIYFEHSGSRISNGDKKLEGERYFDRMIYDSFRCFSMKQKKLVLHAINMRLAKMHAKQNEFASCARRLLFSLFCSPLLFTRELIRLSKKRFSKL